MADKSGSGRKIKESEARYRGLVENTSDAIIGLDLDGSIVSWNRGAENMLGWKEEEIIGHSQIVLVPKEYIETCKEHLKEAILNGNVKEAESARKTRGGKIIPVATTVAAIFDDQGEAVGFVTIFRDITERKEVEEALKESEERYRKLVELSPDGIAVHSEGKICFINTAGARIIGAEDPEELIGKPVLDFVHPDYRDIAIERIRKMMRDGNEGPLIEERFIRLDGKTIDVEVSAIPITFRDKASVQVVIRDTTERKKAEEALKASEEKFRTLAEESPNMVFINVGGRVVYANRKCQEIMGFEREEFYSPDFNFLILIAPDDQGLIKTSYERHMQGKEAKPFDYTLITKNGERLYVIQTTKLIDYEGERGILGILTDITERKRVEEALKRNAAELEDANKLKDLYIDIMHHDILNPAGIIKGATEIMLDDEGSNKDILDIILKNVDKQILMVERATTLSKIRAKDTLEKEAFYLKTIIDHVVKDMRPVFEAQDMAIENRIVKDMPIMANPIIEEVFLNLLSNAAKYAQDDKVVIDAQEVAGGYRVMVADHGPGIPDDVKEAIFTRFHREYKGGVKGTGLGLAIAKRIVDLHGGEIWVEDNPGGGSIFFVELPKGGQ